MKRKRGQVQELKDRLAEKTAEHQRTQRVAQVAMHDAREARAFGEAVCHGVAAVQEFIRAGHDRAAELVINAIRAAHVDELRRQVRREPGGVDHEDSQ